MLPPTLQWTTWSKDWPEQEPRWLQVQYFFSLSTLSSFTEDLCCDIMYRSRSASRDATTHVQYIDSEIQTWRSYSKNSSIRIWFFVTQQQEKVTENHEVDKNEVLCRYTLERDD